MYEFEYGTKNSRFVALSSVIQGYGRFAYATASVSAQDFEKYKGILERIISSFAVSSSQQQKGETDL